MQLLKAISCQMLALLVVWLAAGHLPPAFIAVDWLLALQAFAAALLSRLFRQPYWWQLIHLLFAPALGLVLTLHAPPLLFLGLFLLLLLIFWGTVYGEVPLFLSSHAVVEALQEIIAEEAAGQLIELGAGVGSVVVPLARQCPLLQITAIENAPIPWLILRWRCRSLANVRVCRGNFWKCKLDQFDLAFAFLSPLVMTRLEDKCRREMNGLLVSASFPMAGLTAETAFDLPDRRQTRLYCYRFASPDGGAAISGRVAD